MLKDTESGTVNGESTPLIGAASTDSTTADAPKKKSSNAWASANIIKSFIGVGILALPDAIKNGGIWFGVLMLLLVAIISNYTIKIMVRSKNGAIAAGHDCNNFIDIGRAAAGRWGSISVRAALICSQFGTCVAYIIFIAKNLNAIYGHISTREWMLILLPILLFLTYLRDMKYLAPFSALGIVAVVLATGLVLVFGFRHFNPSERFPFINLSTSPLFFGVAVFALEGNLLAISIEDSMERRHDYPWILDACMLFVSLMYIGFAMSGYLCFGDATQSIITANLKDVAPTAVVWSVQILLAIELLASYGVQIYPLVEMAELSWAKKYASWREVRRYVLRTIIVLITLGFALFVPYFGLVVNLIGAFSNTIAGFILPPIFLLIIIGKTMGKPEKAYNIFIIIFGIIGGGIATAVSVKSLVHCIVTDGKAAGCK